jgi:hypothetical protein
MSEEQKPMTKWQECKAIVEALAPTPPPEDPELVVRKLRATLLAQIAAGSEKGAALAARLADANGPIEVADEDCPEELMQQLLSVPPEKRRSL